MEQTTATSASAQDPADQAEVNARRWRESDLVKPYAGSELRPVEEVLLERLREQLGGRLLEVGCGAGRVTGHLLALGADVVAIDISPAMVAATAARHPGARVLEGDLRRLQEVPGAPFDAVLALYNVIDVVDDAGRREVLASAARLLAPGGLLVFSTHNLAYAPRIRSPFSVRTSRAKTMVGDIVRMPRRARNRSRLRPLEQHGPGYAVLVDEAHEYTLLHYYIGRDEQERQLRDLGLELLECRDLDGREVPPGAAVDDCSELHFVARPLAPRDGAEDGGLYEAADRGASGEGG